MCKPTNTDALADMASAPLNCNYEWTRVLEGKRFLPGLTPGTCSRIAHTVETELRLGDYSFSDSQGKGEKELPGKPAVVQVQVTEGH